MLRPLLLATLLAATPALAQTADEAQLTADAAFLLGYDLGVAFGEQQAFLVEQGVGLDTETVIAGFRAGLLGEDAPHDEEAAQAIISAFQDYVFGLAGREAREAGDAFRATYAQQDDVQATESGLLIRTLRAGDGASPSAGGYALLHYEGRLVDGTVFDSSHRRGEPARFPLAGVIPGFSEGLRQMQVGGEYELVIPAELAYGNQAPPTIGPGQTLVFRIELLSVE